MQQLQPASIQDTDSEYRAIEAALLESARGRWFLAEHGRRARRLDSALLEDAIGRLETSLRQPPALLGQLKYEIEQLKSHIATTRADLVAKSAAPAETAAGTAAPHHAPMSILKAAEDIHDIAWSLQANPFDPKGCEEIARNAGRLYVLSQSHAIHSERTLKVAEALDGATQRLEAILETVLHELQIDNGRAAVV
jgi:hypothetical protein